MAKHDGRDDKTGKFLKGNAGGGRPMGARSKLGEAFIEAMLADFGKNGVKAIERVRAEHPDQYLKIVASILPKEIAAEVSHQYVARMPEVARTTEEWLDRYKPVPH